MQQEPFSSVEDFVFDPTFRDWLLDNNSVYKSYWENWMTSHPDKVPLLNYAKAIVYALTVNHQQLSDEEVEEEIRTIMQKVSSLETTRPRQTAKPPVRISKRIYRILAVAASLFGISILLFLFFKGKPSAETAALETTPSSRTVFSDLIEQSNQSDSVHLVAMTDGSTVRLFPRSKLTYSKSSFNSKREIHLTGEAVFDVVKNPSVPFIVFTQDLVTKVLGTTFTVRAYANATQASVEVKTGKVSVYRKQNFSGKTAVANQLDGLIVIPNQQVIYDAVSSQLRKTIVPVPVPLSANSSQSFVFNSTPLKDVFKTLEKIYGITIIYDESVISSCSLSASMGDESFYEKLELICKAINASYESIDGTIYISSQGCG